MKKETVIQIVNDFSEEIELENLFETLLIRDKIEQGLKQIENGEIISHEKVVKYFNNKFKS